MKNRLLPVTVSLIAILLSSGCAVSETNPVDQDKTAYQQTESPTDYGTEPILPTQEPEETYTPEETLPAEPSQEVILPSPTPTLPPTPTPSVTPTPTPTPSIPVVEIIEVKGEYYTTTELNVRTGPGVEHATIDKLGKGDKVPTDAEHGTWKRIAGSQYWISGLYLTDTLPPENNNTGNLESKVRKIMNTYGCSSVGISFDDPRLGEVANGKADWSANQVLVRSTTPSERLTYVVAHECMHMLQYQAYNSDVNQLSKDMNKIYGGNGYEGLEQNADCMTQAKGIKVYNYTQQCDGSRGVAAKSVLNGQKYKVK